jgi:outer membrane protein assembly factor BamD
MKSSQKGNDSIDWPSTRDPGMRKLNTRGALCFCLVILLACTGCSSIKKMWNVITGAPEPDSAQELAWAGMDAYESKNYKDAIEYFEDLRDLFPFSKYAILAELKIGDAHYKLEQYEDAVFAYEEFEKLHPRNEAIPYVIYQMGRCYFDQVKTIDRDQTPTRKALDTFTRLQKTFPQNEYSQLADEHIDKCIKSLAGHEYQIGLFYYRSNRYLAAQNRFKRVISDYPDVGYHKEALKYIAECRAKLDQTESDSLQ